jgi:hypothetical protein
MTKDNRWNNEMLLEHFFWLELHLPLSEQVMAGGKRYDAKIQMILMSRTPTSTNELAIVSV